MKPRMTIALLILMIPSAFLMFSCSDEKAENPTPVLSASQTRLVFTSLAGKNPYPATQKVVISNSGVGSLTFQAATTASWIRILRVNDSLFIQVKSDAFATGQYSDVVTITSSEASNSPLEITVDVTVTERVSALPDELGFEGLAGGTNPAPQTFEVLSLGGVAADFAITSGAGWIDVGPASGQTPDTITVNVDLTGLQGGIYYDSIVITTADLEQTHLSVPCSLVVSSWLLQDAGGDFSLRGLSYIDAQTGWISGYLPRATEPFGVAYRTDNAGADWNRSAAQPPGVFGGVAFIDQFNGWIVGNNGGDPDSARMIQTVNGGDNWTFSDLLPVDSGYSLRQICFHGTDSGWVVGNEGVIINTVNSGVSWKPQVSGTDFDLNDIAFLNADEGWVCGNHGLLLHTANGGHDWSQVSNDSTQDLNGIDFVDNSHGWVVGRQGLVLATSDGGTTWTAQTTGTDALLLDVDFVNTMRGWAVGSAGTILHTSDGGDTWVAQLSEVEAGLFGVQFFDDNTGVVVGNEGVVLRTLSGGF